MDSIFDYSKTYSGVVNLSGETYPCNLSFPEGEITFKLVGKPTSPQAQLKLDFTGYISTERGIMNYRAIDSMQTHWSSGSFGLSRQEFQADELLVGSLDSDINLDSFGQVNICYNHLDAIGNFIVYEQDTKEELKFTFRRLFESIKLLNGHWGRLSLENPVRHYFSFSGSQCFRLEIDPFFCCLPKSKISLLEVQHLSNRLGWFTQMLFNIRQQPIDVVLFKTQNKQNQKTKNDPYYYLAPELIRRKMNKKPGSRFPSLKINDIMKLIGGCYVEWNKFDGKQLKLVTLFYNEINSSEYIVDDRFKNLCAIVQGLELLGTSTKIKDIRGEMNSKLRRGSTTEFEDLLRHYITIPVLHKLYEIIGHQRDHFQHLSKDLDYDLNEDTEQFAAVNTLLAIMIRYHLLVAIALPPTEIAKAVKQEMAWIRPQIKNLEINIKRKYHI
ncbi:hypothetical protein [Pedobacter sp.]